MQAHKSWLSRLAIGLWVVFVVLLLLLFISTGSLTDAPWYPLSLVVPGVLLIVSILGWSIARLATASGALRIPRSISVIAASLSAIAMLRICMNLLELQTNPPRTSDITFWLILPSIILSLVANIVETGWGKTNWRAWLRAIGAACIGAILLIGFLLAWTFWL